MPGKASTTALSRDSLTKASNERGSQMAKSDNVFLEQKKLFNLAIVLPVENLPI